MAPTLPSVFYRSFAAFIALIAAVCVMPLQSHADDRYASIVIDMGSGQVLHDRFADSPRYPASLTKVMTLYMVFNALDNGELTLDEQLPVSRRASQAPPSRLGLAPGDTISVQDAILALVTKSANDVAVVVAERLGGSESRFAALMTVQARALGMQNTRFYNAHGLPDTRQISTARDLAILAQSMMEDHPNHYAYFATQEFRYRSTTYRNHNRLLGVVPGVDGIKTGYTRASGYNLMATAQRDGNRVIAVMLGGATSRARNTHVTELLEAAFTAIDMTGPAEPDLRTRIAFQAIQFPDSENTVTALANTLQLEQGSAGGE
ncbi:D-alanyl-D-alanine carboxypeptidase family protein [Ponticaulis sp.]|jgi:D-alanyl-D-alanine carboxypeptidase|uniref:D-alanyl-D-alanine carboxypeptidase family protein n=1 Tax=Ponticaulis sp. TaxID=2020902 RepID=UPI000C62F6D4|nr:D-alanyl-D-alanine carboxypeptidase family protein [Ponticaulis sp.]MBN04445.1 penicillin-binding protein [Ponticaulis sp.]